MQSIHDLYKFPLVGLAPMDGVSDVAFREITKKYGNPDVMFTEFVHVMGLCFAAQNLLKTLEYTEIQRPIIAQIFGKEPEYFYHAAKIVCALGFDGVDINMGCPASSVTSRGAGAALIKTPFLALEIINETKRGVSDWVSDGKLTGLTKKAHKAVVQKVESNRLRFKNSRIEIASWGQQNLIGVRTQIPVTVKTRIGYDTPVATEWIKTLSQAKPEWISVHGRTLKQMYTGEANWNELKKAVDATDIPVLTNGDVKTSEDISRILEFTKSSGVLIGRASFGNPWIFSKDLKSRIQKPSQNFVNDISKVTMEHAQTFVKFNPNPKAFVQMRKHLGWYAKTLQSELKNDSVKELKMRLVRVESLEELKDILNNQNLYLH